MLDTPIIVSDEKIEKGDLVSYKNIVNNEWEILQCQNINSEEIYFTDSEFDKLSYCTVFKIIAGLPELPKIDFNGFEEQLGIIDVKKLSEKFMDSLLIKNTSGEIKYGFIKGFKAAQKLNEKKFSEESLRLAMRLFHDRKLKTIDDIIQYLSQPKVFDIEVEMEECDTHLNDACDVRFPCCKTPFYPKITDNLIKITKIL